MTRAGGANKRKKQKEEIFAEVEEADSRLFSGDVAITLFALSKFASTFEQKMKHR